MFQMMTGDAWSATARDLFVRCVRATPRRALPGGAV